MTDKATHKQIKRPCKKCMNETNHEILCESEDHGDIDYDYYQTYMVVKCMGCDSKSFMYLYEDRENAYPVSEDEWEFPTTIDNYPKFVVGHRVIDTIYHVPKIVRSIYSESLLAVQEKASILAGLGLRGTIEAICNDRNISGRSLDVRISRLAQQGLISQKDADRLHAIRFLGNDAAHEIKAPKEEQINVALKIIEHLISSVYILDEEVKGNLETVVNEYISFKSLLEEHLGEFSPGDEYPLAKILGKDIRRLNGKLAPMEANLISEINDSKFTRLTVGKLEKYAGSKEPLQHFVVV